MDRQHGLHASLRLRADALAGEVFRCPIGMQCEGLGVDIREHRPGPCVGDGRRRGHEGEGRGKDKISRADS